MTNRVHRTAIAPPLRALVLTWDLPACARLYRVAAEQGNAGAQYSLGCMLEHGRGIPQDVAEAVRMYRLAVDQVGVRGVVFECADVCVRAHVVRQCYNSS